MAVTVNGKVAGPLGNIVTAETDPVTGGISISWLGKYIFPTLVADGVADDSAAINAVIQGTTATKQSPICIKLPAGRSVGLANPIVMKSYVKLDISGVSLVHLGVKQKNIITNTARTMVQRQVTDAVLTANSTTLSSDTAAFGAADVGRSVWLPVGSVGTLNAHFTARIKSVTDANNAVMDAAPSASATGATAKIYDRDSGISIIGDSQTRIFRTASALTDGNDQHSIVLVRADEIDIGSLYFNSTDAKYFILLNDVSKFKVSDITFNCNSDAVHITGPASHGEVSNLRGNCSDDMLALGCTDYAKYCEAQGSIYNVNGRSLTGESRAGGLHLFCGNSDPNHSISGVNVSGIRGSFVNQSAKIESGSGDTASIIDDIHVCDIAPSEIYPAGPAILIESRVGTVTLHNITDSGASGVSDFVRLNAAFKKVLIDGFIRQDASRSTGVVNIPTGKTGDTIQFKNLSAVFNAAANADIISISGQLSNLVFDGFNIAGHSGVKLVNAGAEQTALNIGVANGYAAGFAGAYLYWLNGQIDLNINNTKHGSCYMAVSARSATTVVTVRGSGFSWSPTIFAQGESTGKVRLRSFDAVGEIDRPGIEKAAGNYAYNTKAALSCGVGMVISDGTSWKHMFTGAVY